MTSEEREKALRDELEMCRRLLRDVRLLNRSGQFKQFEGEPWIVRIMNIDLESDPVEVAAAFAARMGGE